MKSSNKLPIVMCVASALALSTTIIYYNLKSKQSLGDTKEVDQQPEVDKTLIQFPTNKEIEDAFDLPEDSIRWSSQNISCVRLNIKKNISVVNSFYARWQLGWNIFDRNHYIIDVNIKETFFTHFRIKDPSIKNKFDLFSNPYVIKPLFCYSNEDLQSLKLITESISIERGRIELSHTLGLTWKLKKPLKENQISFFDRYGSFSINDANEFNQYVIKKCKEKEIIYKLLDLRLLSGPASIVKSYYCSNNYLSRKETDNLIPVSNIDNTRFTF